MGDAVSRCGRCCVGGQEEDHMLCCGGLVVSVPAFESSGPNSIYGVISNFKSRNLNHAKMSEIYAASEMRGESQTIPRYFSCNQSQTFPMFTAFWPLHSYLYLKNSRVFWDSVH